MKFLLLLAISAIIINGTLSYSWWSSSDDKDPENVDEINNKLKLKRANNDNEDEDIDYDSENGNNGNGDNGGSDDDGAGDDSVDTTTTTTTESTRVTLERRYSDPRLRQSQPQQPSAQCNRQQYRCHYSGICIESSLVCNGQSDCLHGDDERECASIAQSNSQCASQEFQCQGTPVRCINTASVCDGTYHCQYGDDEANCNERNVQDIRTDPPQTRPYIPERERTQPQPVTTEQSRTSIPERQPLPQPRPTYTEENQVQSRPSIADRDASRQQPQTRPTNTDANSSKDKRMGDDYIQRLEWRDRCVRSCLRY